jgi:UDP-N-acetylglucosamine transferase subunit ALG13
VNFVTVGSELPFDRLTRAMDAWAASHPGEDVLAQIGAGSFLPGHMRWERRMGRAAYAAAIEAAELVVAHAGMGSVVTAGVHGRPIVLLPRRVRFGEVRNEHQLEAAARLADWPGIAVAGTEAELPERIAAARAAGAAGQVVSRTAPAAFLARLRAFVLE